VDVRDFDFDLPPESIAQEPARERTAARLLHLNRDNGAVTHSTVADLARFLRAGDLLVVNNTRVFPARLFGRRVPSGGCVECLLIRRLPTEPGPAPAEDLTVGPAPHSELDRADVGPRSQSDQTEVGAQSDLDQSGVGPAEAGHYQRSSNFRHRPESDRSHVSVDSDGELWEALMHPGQKLKPGARVVFDGPCTLRGEVLERHFFGRRIVRLWTDDGSDVSAAVDAIGHVPLPPYIKRDAGAADRDRYQTMFARARGSVAAPTAGLHFTPALLDALSQHGVDVAEVTLHVGYGTFQPVRVDRVENHQIEAEHYEISDAAAASINRALDAGRRVIAVGTTSTRTLEAVGATSDGRIAPGTGAIDLFIYPGFVFRIIGGLLTNFHLPRSSLLMLVSAFAGRERVLAAYRDAIADGYRFYSYGDAMLII
jgi:S-adenosylmethionine:tRNA ribosyltransferase-isomerase